MKGKGTCKEESRAGGEREEGQRGKRGKGKGSRSEGGRKQASINMKVRQAYIQLEVSRGGLLI